MLERAGRAGRTSQKGVLARVPCLDICLGNRLLDKPSIFDSRTGTNLLQSNSYSWGLEGQGWWASLGTVGKGVPQGRQLKQSFSVPPKRAGHQAELYKNTYRVDYLPWVLGDPQPNSQHLTKSSKELTHLPGGSQHLDTGDTDRIEPTPNTRLHSPNWLSKQNNLFPIPSCHF